MTKKFIFIIFIKIKFAFSINDHQLTENRLTKKYLDNFTRVSTENKLQPEFIKICFC